MQITHKRVWGHEENIRTWCLDAFQFEELQTKTTLKNAYEEAFIKKRMCCLYLTVGMMQLQEGARIASGPEFYSNCRDGRRDKAELL